MQLGVEWLVIANMGEKSTHTLPQQRKSHNLLFLLAQMTCLTWHVPCTLSWNSPLWLMVSHYTVHMSAKPKIFLCWVMTYFSPVSLLGCKVDMFDLKVEAVNTHRDRPLVSLWPFGYFTSYTWCQFSVVHVSSACQLPTAVLGRLFSSVAI